MENKILEDLLERWEQAVENGGTYDPEYECRNHPELLELLRNRIAALQSMNRFQTLTAIMDTPKATTASRSAEFDGSRVVSQSEYTGMVYHDRGGLGRVYRAYDSQLHRKVAIKLIPGSSADDSETRDRFLREAEITGRLEHPGIVAIYGQGETFDGRPFYVMPFLQNGSLADEIDAFHRRFPYGINEKDSQFRDLLNRLVSICKTIAYAHSRGIVHRDIKPKNIMLGKYGETLIIDWGLAGRVDRDERYKWDGEHSIELCSGSGSSSNSGGLTPLFASPEQLNGVENVGPASDIYNLGLLLYAMLTGRPPFAGLPTPEICRRSVTGEFDLPQEVKPGISRALQAICLKALSQDPTHRYSTGLEMAEDINRFLADAPILAVKESMIERWTRTARKRWPAMLGICVALVLLSTVMGIFAVQQGRLRRHADYSSTARLKMATTFAAQAGAGEIDRRWRIMEFEAASRRLHDALVKATEAGAVQADWEQIQNWLYERFVHYKEIENIKFDSWFINSAEGVQIARVPRSDTIGTNFAYRDYFHGQGFDLAKGEVSEPSRTPILSGVYVSKSDHGVMKIAFTVPIWSQDDTTPRRIIARLGMSVRIGDLQIFRGLGDDGQIPMLVETRNYKWGTCSAAGLILDHPEMRADPLTTSAERQSEESEKDSRPRLAAGLLSRMRQSWSAGRREEDAGSCGQAMLIDSYRDPFTSDTRNSQAAYMPIVVPGRDETVGDTGWYVVLRQQVAGRRLADAPKNSHRSN